MRILQWEPDFSPLQESPIAPVWVRFEDHSRQCVAEVNNADHVFDKRSHPSVNGDKVFDKRSQSVIPVAEVFVKLPDPTLPKNTAPSSSSAGYSNNHRKKVAHSQVWKPINSTGAQNTLEQNTSKQGNNDTSLHKVDGKIDASILKADLSNLDQGPALSNSGMLHTVIEEDEQGLELSSAGQITETIAVEDISSDLAGESRSVVEHCEEVQGSTTSVLQQLDQDVDAINRSVGTECTGAELRNVAECVGAEIQLPQVQHQQVVVKFVEQQQVQVTGQELEQNLENGSLVQLEGAGMLPASSDLVIPTVVEYGHTQQIGSNISSTLKQIGRVHRFLESYKR
ncbi:hypothetical protein Leryth_024407 [Lithospermum erythrorhizon]|nr:hypothetical protein Leryth_024407 [Lithospermum erythrorhizon]